jgi:uncharacterized protein YdcH (DUF465 family)
MASKTPHLGRKTNPSEKTKKKNLRDQQRAIVSGVNHIVNPSYGTVLTDYAAQRVERTSAKRKKAPMDLSKPQRRNKRGKALQQHILGSGPDPEWRVSTDRADPLVYRHTRRVRLCGVETLLFWRYIVSENQEKEGPGKGKGEEGVIMTQEDYVTFDRDDPSESERTTRSEVTTDKDGRPVVVETVDAYMERIPVDVAFYNVSINTERIYEWAHNKRIHKTDLAQAVASILRNETKPHTRIMGIDYNCMRKGLAIGNKGATAMLERLVSNLAYGLPAELLVMNKWKGTRDNLHIVPIWAIYPMFCCLPQSVIEVNNIFGMCFDLFCNLIHKAPRDVGWDMERLNQAIEVFRISLNENDAHFQELLNQRRLCDDELKVQVHEIRTHIDAVEAYVKTQQCKTSDEIFKMTEEIASWSKRIQALEEANAKRESEEKKRVGAGWGKGRKAESRTYLSI